MKSTMDKTRILAIIALTASIIALVLNILRLVIK